MNIIKIRELIDKNKIISGRKDDVKILAVTKTQNSDKIRNIINQGIHLIGENRIQESRIEI